MLNLKHCHYVVVLNTDFDITLNTDFDSTHQKNVLYLQETEKTKSIYMIKFLLEILVCIILRYIHS